MAASDARKLREKIDELDPSGTSVVYPAQDKIVEISNRLAEAGEIELPSSFVPYSGDPNKISDSTANNDSLRMQARVLFTLDDSYLRFLNFGIEVTDWADCLWYLNDVRLTRKVFAFSIPSRANALLSKLSVRWRVASLDAATEMQLENARQATKRVLNTTYQLIDKGAMCAPSLMNGHTKPSSPLVKSTDALMACADLDKSYKKYLIPEKLGGCFVGPDPLSKHLKMVELRDEQEKLSGKTLTPEEIAIREDEIEQVDDEQGIWFLGDRLDDENW